MNNLIPFPLPAGPFFCARDGRYLPSLTDLVIQGAAMVQRREIEEQLLKLRLKQKCFLALAARAPHSVFPVEGSDQADLRSSEGRGPLGFYSGTPASDVHFVSPAATPPPVVSSSALVKSSDPINPYKKGRW